MASKQNYFYDLEVYPNLFTATFKQYENTTIRQFVIWRNPDGSGDDLNESSALVDFLIKEVVRLIGYNNDNYDNVLLNYLLVNRERLLKSTARRITDDLKMINDYIIHTQYAEEIDQKIMAEIRGLKKLSFFRSLDLLSMFNTIDRASLKQIAINLKWYNVMDLPHDTEHIVQNNEIKEILEYNLNDVLITEHLLLTERAQPFLLRRNITAKYKIDVLSANDTDIAKSIITKFYLEETKMSLTDFRKGRTFYTFLHLKDCISPRIKLQSKESLRLLKALRETKIDPNKKKDAKKKKQFEFIYRSKYITHTIGLGGIHSINPPEIITEDEEFGLMDIDATSFYPYIIVNDNLYPRHLGPMFPKIYKKYIVDMRVKAKKEGDKIAAEALKITANSTYGLTKSEYSFLYDPKLTTTVCVSGQLYLIMLMEAIETHTRSMVVYSNTDGLTIRYHRDDYHNVMRLCNIWSTYTGFQLEYVHFRKMVLKDINNFLIFTHDPYKPLKEKGVFVINRPIYKGYDYPVISKALVNYYDKDIPVEDTINNCRDIFMFMKAQRMDDSKFFARLDKKDGTCVRLQKNNRWVVSHGHKEEGKLYQVDKRDGSETEMQKDYFVSVLNSLPKDQYVSPDDVGINYSFYINETLKITNVIRASEKETHVRPELKQAKLFL